MPADGILEYLSERSPPSLCLLHLKTFQWTPSCGLRSLLFAHGRQCPQHTGTQPPPARNAMRVCALFLTPCPPKSPLPSLLQEKANLDRQLKSINSRSTLLEKNLEKQGVQAEKRRESIMVRSPAGRNGRTVVAWNVHAWSGLDVFTLQCLPAGWLGHMLKICKPGDIPEPCSDPLVSWFISSPVPLPHLPIALAPVEDCYPAFAPCPCLLPHPLFGSISLTRWASTRPRTSCHSPRSAASSCPSTCSAHRWTSSPRRVSRGRGRPA